ncbi:MAG: orotate phosphoribosyltransferase [Anaerolineae bacterium]|nr:orotate phosphoribosyltransferase [Anaerolineae bacterium]
MERVEQQHASHDTSVEAQDQTLRAEVLAAAVLRGQFTLRSGKISSYYVDKYRFQVRPQLLRRVAARLADLVPAQTQVLAGVELGAVPLVTAVSLHTGLPFVIVRKGAKEYGTANLIEGGDIAGRAVTLVEDVCTTGGAALAAAEKIARAGGRLLRIVTVIDRGEGGIDRERAAGYDAVALFTLSPEDLA